MTKRMYFLAGLVTAISCCMMACGSSGNNNDKALKDLVPLSGEITGWDEDLPAPKNEAGPQVATCATGTLGQGCASDWINGAIDSINKGGGWKGLAQEFYIKGDLKLSLFINEMKDTAAASQAFTDMANYVGVTWTSDTLGAGEQQARHGKALSYWLVDASKKKYFLEVEVKPPSNASAEAAALDFMKAVLNKIP